MTRLPELVMLSTVVELVVPENPLALEVVEQVEQVLLKMGVGRNKGLVLLEAKGALEALLVAATVVWARDYHLVPPQAVHLPEARAAVVPTFLPRKESQEQLDVFS